ncbi:MAG: hypothetical protein AAGF94_14840 [Pseudomonadota bacterium]
MSETPYDKAVASFEALLDASSRVSHAKPVRLIKESGQNMTTGYRHTAALEADGFLRRDESGVYLRGTAALRTSLSAFGFGRLAPVIEPVLRRLKDGTQHTSFLAIIEESDVCVGPYFQGRATRHIKLAATYRIEISRALSIGDASEVTLVPVGSETGARLNTLMTPVASRALYTAVLGFALTPARLPDRSLFQALSQAAEQIAP